MASTAPKIDVDRAVRLNARYSVELNWQPLFDRIVTVLGFTNVTPDPQAFAEAIAAWQRRQGLEADGVLGPATWGMLQTLLLPGAATVSPPGIMDFAGWSAAEVNALRLTTTFENGRPLEFGGLTGDFDGCGCSFGLLQWNIGSESLQPLLAEFARERPDRFADIFGPDAPALLAVLQMKKQPHEDSCTHKTADLLQASHPALAWAKSINDYRNPRNPVVVEAWADRFRRLGADHQFRAIEARWSRKAIDRAESNARELGLKTERGLALMVDCVTQNGMRWLDHRRHPTESTRRELIAQRRAEIESNSGRHLTEGELMEVIARVVASSLGRPEWAADVLQRRMIIASGNGIRGGRRFDLAKDFNLTDSPWEAPATSVGTPHPSTTAVMVPAFVQLPESGAGFYSYSPSDRQFGRPEVIDALKTIAAAWNRTNPAAPRIGIGDISLQSGGDMSPHRSHRDGAEADLRPMRSDNREEPVSYVQEAIYSRPLTQALVKVVRTTSPLAVVTILFNDVAIDGVQRWEGHDNHLHVHFRSPG